MNTTNKQRGIAQVDNLHALYVSQKHDFGITCAEFEALLNSAVPEGKVAAHRLIKTFDCESSNLVDVLEVMCGLVVCCTASIEEKAKRVFDLFDFDGTKKVSYDELFIMMFSALRSMVRILGKGIEPDDSDVEKMADEIFLKADKEPVSFVTRDEFVAWFMDECNFGTKKGQLKAIGMAKLMLKFDVLDEEDAEEIEQQRLMKLASAPVSKVKRKTNHGHHKSRHHHGHHKAKAAAAAAGELSA